MLDAGELIAAVDGHPNRNRTVVTYFSTDHLDRLELKPGAVLQGAAIAIRPTVGMR